MPETFYDQDGLCHWCFKPSIIDWCGIGLCEDHWDEEQREILEGG